MTRPDPEAVRTIAVVGTGTIGKSWAAYFLARGFRVRATDPAAGAPASLERFVEQAWPALVALGHAEARDPAALSFHPTIAEAVRGAEFVQENGPEVLGPKAKIIAEIDRAAAADIVIASSTSALLMTPLQAGCRHPGRCVLAHPFNPPHLVPLVELSGGAQTEPAALDWAVDFYRAVGRSPVRLNREIYGHIGNRLQYALWNEAVRLVLEGVASVEDIDVAVRDGPGLRWGFQGPFATYNLAGGDGGLARFFEIFAARDAAATDRVARLKLTSEQRQVLIDGVDRAVAGRPPAALAAERDRRLLEFLKLRRALRIGEEAT